MIIHIGAVHYKFFILERVIDAVLMAAYIHKQPNTMTAMN